MHRVAFASIASLVLGAARKRSLMRQQGAFRGVLGCRGILTSPEDGKITDGTTTGPVKIGGESNAKKFFSKDGLGHEMRLPERLIKNIPEKDVRVIRFLLDYLKDRALPIDGVLVNGGYVRDLILGSDPDDLDISLCLVGCEPQVTVGWILEDLQSFIHQKGFRELEQRYGFNSFKSVNIHGDISKDKQLDTAKAVFGYVGDEEPHFEVDLMPTIGEEHYEDEGHRIPTRDQRGTPVQDALRRDLTVGALLLKVNIGEEGDLEWKLLDFYGGVDDIEAGVLRAPFPETLYPDVVFTNECDSSLATKVGLNMKSPQQAWWVKILRDDPLRIVRTFRFSAKLNFRIHEDFWKAIPFALANLQSKVAGSRKMTEILKIARYGNRNLEDFFLLCFHRRFVFSADGKTTCLASGIFGGKDIDSMPHFLPDVQDIDDTRFLAVTRQSIPSFKEISADEIVGLYLAIGIYSSELPPHETWSDAAIDDSKFESILEQGMERACRGLCTSNELREAGQRVLRCFAKLRNLGSLESTPVEEIVQSRLSKDVPFAKFLKIWNVLQMSKTVTNYSHDIVASMLENFPGKQEKQSAAIMKEALKVFREAERVKLSGKGISNVKELPPQLRGPALAVFHVFLRLKGCSENLDADNALKVFLETECDKLLTSLLQEWLEKDGRLRDKYGPRASPTSTSNSSKKKKSKNL